MGEWDKVPWSISGPSNRLCQANSSHNLLRLAKRPKPYAIQGECPMARFIPSTRFQFALTLFLSGLVLAGCGGYSAPGNGGNGGGGSAPPTPTGLTASGVNAQVNLSWSASSGATAYYLKRSTTTGGPYTQIASPTATNYADNGVTNGAKYYYVVSAYNSYGVSANSTEVSATPVAPPPPTNPPSAPTGLQATPENAQVSLSWTASTGATSYHVKRSTTSGSGFSYCLICLPRLL